MSNQLAVRKLTPVRFSLDFRLMWYSVVVWLLAIFVGGFVVLPWFYIVLPFTLLIITIHYFKRDRLEYKKQRRMFAKGLFISLVWFLFIITLDFLQIIGFDFKNAQLYFLDSRNYLKIPLVLLLPIIYTLVIETIDMKKRRRGRPIKLPPVQAPFGVD